MSARSREAHQRQNCYKSHEHRHTKPYKGDSGHCCLRFLSDCVRDVAGHCQYGAQNAVRSRDAELVAAEASDGQLSAGHARTLLGLNDKELIPETAKQVIEEKLSVRQTEQLVKSLNRPPRAPTPKPRRDTFYDEVELALSDVLARQVTVTTAGEGGRLTIEFFDADDLKKLAAAFGEE